MTLDKAIFYDKIRGTFPLTSKNVDGFDFIIDEGTKRNTPLNDLAYILATTWWETAHTMQPIEEYGKGKGRAYGTKDATTGKVYFGRGYVQLTWKANYKKAGDILGIDFVNKPELVMLPEHAVKILFDGMYEGWFTGKKLRDYIDLVDEDYNEDLREFSNARRIINGTDKQVIIGQLAISLEGALRASGYTVVGTVPNPTQPTVQPSVAQSEPIENSEVGELIITIRRSDLSNTTLAQFLEALNQLKSET